MDFMEMESQLMNMIIYTELMKVENYFSRWSLGLETIRSMSMNFRRNKMKTRKQKLHLQNIMRALGNKAKKKRRESYDKIAQESVSPSGGVTTFGSKKSNQLLTNNEKSKRFKF